MTAAVQPKRRVRSARAIAKILRVRIEVARELRAAYIAGQGDTPLRPFLDWEERCGAMKCCRSIGRKSLRRCPRPSTHVRYLVGFPGRVAYCAKHAAEVSA